MDEHTRDMMAAMAYVIAQLKQESWHYQQIVQKYDSMTDDDLMRNDYNKIIQDELAEAKAEIEKLGRICEEKDAKITELRQELQANKDADTLLCDENRRLLESLEAKDTEIAKLRLMAPEIKPSEVYTEEPNKEAYRIKVDPPTEADPGEEVDTEHFCKDCRHSNENGSNTVYCCLKELLYEKSAYACGSFNSKPRKKKLPEE